MRDIIVYTIFALVLFRVDSQSLCDISKCVCVSVEKSLKVTCTSYPIVLDTNYNLPDNITNFDLSRNNLISIQRQIISDTLIEFSLAYNEIKEIATEVFYLPSLKILDLSHNNLKFIDRDTFKEINNLQYLNLASNKFTTVGYLNFHHLKFLHELILDDNILGPSLENHSLFDGGCNLTNEIQRISLKNVSLNDNNVNMFLKANESLKNLTLAHNNLTTIVVLPDKLQYLDVSNNPIKNISWDDFFDAIYLRVLKLNNILIEEVPDFAFFYLCSLQELELAGNGNLKKFSPLSWGSVILKDQIDLLVENFSLKGGNLTSLDRRMKGIFQKIKNVDLRDNPWNCDCKLAWLQNIPIPQAFEDFRCATPQNLFNKRVLEVNSSELICEKNEHLEDYQNVNISIIIYCILLATAVLMMYAFIFPPKPIIYRVLPVEFPSTP